jgi:hypothetical protein
MGNVCGVVWYLADLTRWAIVWAEEKAGSAATTAAMNFMVAKRVNDGPGYIQSRYLAARESGADADEAPLAAMKASLIYTALSCPRTHDGQAL